MIQLQMIVDCCDHLYPVPLQQEMSVVGKLACWEENVVIVNSCDETSGMCIVSRSFGPLYTATEPNAQQDLNFLQKRTFAEAYPLATTLTFAALRGGVVPSGTVLDVSCDQNIPSDLLVEGYWKITTSCRIIGGAYNAATFLHSCGAAIITKPVHIELDDSTDIVEFENVSFSGTSNICAVFCCSGSNIYFRRCWFTNLTNGVYVQCDEDVVSSMQVFFEECVFDNCVDDSVVLCGKMTVNFLNCTFQNSRNGLCATGDVTVVAMRCTFRNVNKGCYCREGNTVVSVYDSTFSENRVYALQMCNASSLRVVGCLAVSCGCFVSTRGPHRLALHLESCVAQKCPVGVQIMCVRIDSVVKKITFAETDTAIHTRWDVIGNVDLIDTNADSDDPYKFWSSEKCFITINNVRVPPASMEMIRRYIDAERRRVHFGVCQLRMLKKAGVGDVTCFNCFEVEAIGVLYKKCARCKKVCYCSRVCQVIYQLSYSLAPIAILIYCVFFVFL